MVSSHQAISTTEYAETHAEQPRPGRWSWLLGNLLLISGLYLLCYVGGLYADAKYEQLAARGDNQLQPAAVVSLQPSEPNAFVIPVLNQPEQAEQQPEPGAVPHRSTVSRLIIPKINLDSKVIEVGWEIVEQDGEEIAIWQVAKYAVGQHKGSANPGEGDNVVLAGHVGGEAPVFKDLIQLEPGDQLTLMSQDREYLYVVEEKVLVQEVGVPDEVRFENARYMLPTDREVVTMITCWPPAGPHKFDQRLIVRAVPYAADSAGTPEQSGWMPR